MHKFEHIEALWAGHSVEVKISAEEMLHQAKKDVNKMKAKSLLTIMIMVLALLALAATWLVFDFHSNLTHLGISLLVLAVLVYTLILYKNHLTIAKNDFTTNPSAFLQQLKIYQQERFLLYNRLYWFYVLALSLGMIFYFMEVLEPFSLYGKLIAWGFTSVWIIFSSTIIRKNAIKKDKQRIEGLIKQFERISQQFNADNQY